MSCVLGERHNGSRYARANALALSADRRRTIRDGEARFDLGTRAIYAHDSSNFRQVPLGVVLPKSKDEVVLDGFKPELKATAVFGGALAGGVLLWRLKRRFA